jgi:hypothetical protein
LAATIVLFTRGPAAAAVGIVLDNPIIDSPNYYSTGLSGWSFEIASCSYTVNGVAAANCGGEEVIPTVTGNTLSLVYENASGTGTPLLSSSLTGKTNDLNVSVNVKAPGDGSIVSGTASIAGHYTAPGFASIGETISGTTATWSPALTAALNTTPLVTATFKPAVNKLSGADDIAAYSGKMSFTGNSTVTTATTTYTVPEPFSAALLGVGVVGVGFVRRKTRRQTGQ